MNNDDTTTDHARHPEELLATYVEGEASVAERTRVETLLSACTECRREVELAVQARAALQSLPELHAPELRIEGGLPSTAPKAAGSSRRGVLTRARESSWERLAWGAGLVAAGSLVALFVLVQLSGTPSQQGAGQAPQRAAESDLGSTSGARDYTPASLDALARRLVASNRSALAAEQSAPAPAPTQTGEQQPTANMRDRARDCLRRGGGLRPTARLVYVEDASFRGTPAFVGAFESGAPGDGRYLLVLAVDTRTCDALYVINRSL